MSCSSCRFHGSDSQRSRVSTKSASLEPWTSEQAGIQFSPDNRWIAIDAALLAKTGGNGLYVVSTDGAEIRHIQYGSIKDAYWMDDFHVAFKFRYSIVRPIHAVYDCHSRTLETRKDSITYFDKLSPYQTTLCVASRRAKSMRVFTVNLLTGERKSLNIDASLNPFPLSWSPNMRSIILKGRRENRDMLFHYDLVSQQAKLLPVMNAEPCGWSADGTTLYVRRTNYPFANYSGEIFSIHMQTLELRELTGKVEGLLFAEFSAAAKKFLVLRKGNLYLQDSDKEFDPAKIVDNVSAASWSRDGRQIVYVAEKGNLLCLYDLGGGGSKILLNQLTSKQ